MFPLDKLADSPKKFLSSKTPAFEAYVLKKRFSIQKTCLLEIDIQKICDVLEVAYKKAKVLTCNTLAG